MIKIFRSVAAVLAAAAMVSSCTGQQTSVNHTEDYSDPNVNAAGELPIVKERITLNLGVKDYKYVEDYETNAYTKWLEEQTGIDLEFTVFPSSNHMEKLRLQVASDSKLPDILINLSLGEADLKNFGESGAIIDLRDMIENEGYWVKQMFENAIDSDYLQRSILTGEAMYYMPYYIEQPGNDYSLKAFINKKWLDELGLAMPETTEDFYNVMKAFKERDPNGNGKQDEIGITGSKNGWNETVIPFLMNSFVYDNMDNRMVVEDGKVYAAFTTEEWREGLRYMKRLTDEGLFDVQSLTQDNSVLKTLAQNPGDNIIGAFVSGSPDALFGVDNERLAEYEAIPPLKGPDGVAYAYKSNGGSNMGGIITRDCENKLAAFRLLDFMMSEESALRSRYGVPGVDWTEAQEGDVCIFDSIGVEPRIRSILPYNATQNSHWYAQNPQFRSYEIANGIVWDGNPLDGEYFKAKALSAYIDKEPEERVRKLKLSDIETDEYATLSSDIKSYVTEMTSLFIIGRKDIDKDWDEYITTLNNMDVDRYTELVQLGYDNFNE